MLFILRAVPIFLVTPILVRLTGKVDPRIFLGLGFVTIAVGTFIQAAITTAQASFWNFGLALVLTGIGSAMLFIPLSIAVLGATTPAEGPKAGAFVNLSTQLGGSIAVAALAVFLDRRQSFHATILGANATLSNPNVHQFLGDNSIAALSSIVNGQALILAYADATGAISIVCILCAPLIFFMRKPKAPAGPVEVGH
jgi:DHA2 family multidrug resistance protein